MSNGAAAIESRVNRLEDRVDDIEAKTVQAVDALRVDLGKWKDEIIKELRDLSAQLKNHAGGI